VAYLENNSEANAPVSITIGIKTDWRAIRSTRRIDAIANTATEPSPVGDTGVPIYLLDGLTRIADHFDNLWSGDSAGQTILLAPINLTQFGIPIESGVNKGWTGTDYYGHRGGFVGPLGSAFPTHVASAAPNGSWINNNHSASSDNIQSLYPISSVLVAVPEPSTATLLGTIMIGCLQRPYRFVAINESETPPSA